MRRGAAIVKTLADTSSDDVVAEFFVYYAAALARLERGS